MQVKTSPNEHTGFKIHSVILSICNTTIPYREPYMRDKAWNILTTQHPTLTQTTQETSELSHNRMHIYQHNRSQDTCTYNKRVLVTFTRYPPAIQRGRVGGMTGKENMKSVFLIDLSFKEGEDGAGDIQSIYLSVRSHCPPHKPRTTPTPPMHRQVVRST